MIALRVKIVSYNKDVNTCKAELLNGDIIELDPFVACAVELSDEDYHSGKGGDIIGNSYILTEYHVYKDQVVPMENGMKVL